MVTRVEDAKRSALKAVAKIADWTSAGQEFYVSVRHLDSQPGQRHKYIFHINAPNSRQMVTDFATRRPIVGVVDIILEWLQKDMRIEVVILKRNRSDRFKARSSRSSRRVTCPEKLKTASERLRVLR